MALIELILACAAWKRSWQELALIPFIAAMGVNLMAGYLNQVTYGGLAEILSGYLFLFHLVAVLSLSIMLFIRPRTVRSRS